MAGAGKAGMTPEQWQEVKRVLNEALTREGDSREAFLRDLPPDLRREAEAFLDADQRQGAMIPTDVGHADAPSARDPRNEAEPEVLAGRYRIVGMLGRGGMGTVELAHDLRLDCPVAIKRVRDAWIDDDEARRRLLREGRALAALGHPSIARVRDVLDTSPPALVMEYVEGESLAAWLETSHEAADVARVLQQIVEAVAYAHDKGVLHCDLKPRNVIVTPEANAKVVDFGIALVLSRAATTTVVSDTTRRPAFTPKYAAPEVVRGATPSAASDVYSLGVLIEEVLARCERAGQPLPHGLTSALLGVALRAKSEAPQDRYRDAAALLRALPAPGPFPSPRGHYWRTHVAAVSVVLVTCMSLMGDSASGLRASGIGGIPVFAVVTRVDDASANSLSAAAADILRRSMGRLEKSQLVTDTVPPLRTDVNVLVEELQFEGLTHILVPTVSRAGSDVKVSVAIRRASDGRLLTTATRSGPAETLEALTRAVAGDIRDWLGEPKQQALPPLPPLSVRSASQYSEARRYLERPDRDDALTYARSLFESVTRRDPQYAPAHAELSRVLVLLFRQRPDPALLVQARNAADRALALRPELPDGHIALATVFVATGRRDDANAELRKALEVDPNHEHALRLLGQNEVARGHVDEGIAILEKLIRLQESWGNYRALGTVYFNDGRNKEALEHFRALVELQPDNPWGFQMLGSAHHVLGQHDEAVKAYEQSLRLQPTASALTNLATVHYQRNDFAEAERRYAEAAALEPGDPVFHRNLADVQLLRGREPEARTTYGRALAAAEALLAVDANDVRARGNATYAAARQGACDAALAHAAQLEAHAGRQVPALANLANAYGLCGRFTEARSALERLKARGSTPADYLERDVLDQLRQRSEFAALLPSVDP